MALCTTRWSNLLRLRPFISEQLIFLRKFSIKDVIKSKRDLTLNKIIDNREECNAENWSITRNELIQNISNVNDMNVDSLIINRCCDATKPFIAFDYIEYLFKERKQKLNIATVGKYFRLLYNYKKEISSEERDRIYEYYDQMQAQHQDFDSFSAEYCLLALSLTDRWQECFKLLKMIELTSNSRSVAHSAIIAAALNHDELTLGWDQLEKMMPRLKPNFRTYEAYLNYCKKNVKNLADLEATTDKMFDFWMRNDIYPHVEIVTAYASYLATSNFWTYRDTVIGNDGTCAYCKNKLPEINLNEDDFSYFSKYFFHRALVGKDIFTKTTPNELKRFKDYIDDTKPYDVVIDGLNTGYALNRKKKGPSNPAKELKKIASMFLEENKRIFILGRKHMYNWSAIDMDFLKKNCFMFLLNNLSNDDVFILYATLSSGMNTYFVTRDFMREHKLILEDDNLKRIYRHWQMTRQIFPVHVGSGQLRSLKCFYPPLYAPTAHKDPKGWHIPYSIEYQQSSPFDRPKTWICLRKKVELMEKVAI